MGGGTVIGIDASTQSVKAIAWTREGQPAAEGRAPLSLRQPQPGYAEQDANEWWDAACTALRTLTAAVDPAAVEGIAISNQRETVALLDDDGRSLGPAITWLDNRVASTYRDLADSFGAERLHAISGRPVDVIPVIYRLHWLARHQPGLLERARAIVDVHGFLALRLTGTATASFTSADAFGLFDIQQKRWSLPLLEHLHIPLGKLPPAVPPGALIGHVTAAAAAQTGLRAGTPMFAGGGDGQCAGLGVNAMRPGTVYLNLGTAIVAGAWSPSPVLSSQWRTILSPTGGYFLEHAQRAGGFFLNYVVDTFAGGRQDPGVFKRLEAAAAAIPVGAEGLLVCPYLTGCMDPHWNPDARATVTGLGPHHTAAHLYRAALEALTLEAARAIHAMRDAGLATDEILAIGGGAESRLWLQMIADSVGVPTCRSLSNEASCLGAAIIAATGAGWHGSMSEAAAAMTQVSGRLLPEAATAATWERLSVRQAALYAATLPLQAP